MDIPFTAFPSSKHNQPIYVFQSKETRALTVGYISKNTFIPCRLHLGVPRELDTYTATITSLRLQPIQAILHKYPPEKISTITVLRETISCRLGAALYEGGIHNHFGDAFIGATHIKGDGEIRTAYLYENTEGLSPDGLWIIGESFCIGRNLMKTMESLLSQFTPKEILFVAPLASRRAINTVGQVTAGKNIPTTFVAWGGLFGVDEKTLYDMPWGHPDTEPFDTRDKEVFLQMYGPKLCVGGDFGNNYYSPYLSKQLYEAQLKEHVVTPRIPTVEAIKKMYTEGEVLTRITG